jgi:bifunctional ADP-heptose synthase (sugar kinase/adenylyltransferase)
MLVDLVADVFITGIPKRISREAPVLILAYQGERLAPGGGANAVANVAALGGRPLPLGIVGDDDYGRRLLAALAGMGVDTSGISIRAGYRTPTKVRILGGGKHSIKQQIVRYDIEDHLILNAEERARFAAVAGRFGAIPVAILSDYGYGTVEPGMLAALRAALAGPGEAGSAGSKGSAGFTGSNAPMGSEPADSSIASERVPQAAATFVCDSRYRLGEFAGLDGATPNEEEAEALLGAEIDDDWARLEAGGRALRERLAARFLLITRGSRGMSLFTAEGAAHLPVSGTDQVADVTGAGDTVIGTFALGLAAGASPLEAALLANYAGGLVVMKMGTATCTAVELQHAIATDPRPLEELRWVSF